MGGDEIFPGLATGIDDGLICFVDADRQIVFAQVLPDVFDGVHFGGEWRLFDECKIWRDDKCPAGMPSGTVENDDAMGSRRYAGGDCGEMLVHRVGVGIRHDDGRTCGAGRADSTENIGPFVTGVLRFARA